MKSKSVEVFTKATTKTGSQREKTDYKVNVTQSFQA